MTQLTFEDLDDPTPLELKTVDELYDGADETLLRNLSEDRRFEKKPGNYPLRDLGEYVCMWANTVPFGGLIAIGIRDDRIFEGLSSVGANHVNGIEKPPNIYCPDAVWDSRRIRIHRDKDDADDFVLLIRVHYHPTRVVKTSDGRVYTRVGDSKKQLRGDEIRQLQADKGEVRFETESSRLEYPSDYGMPALESFAEMIRSEKDWSKQHSCEEILVLMHLGQKGSSGFRANVACDLLFSKDPLNVVPGAKIRFLRFEGEVEGTGATWNAIKDENIEGTIPDQIEGAADMLRSQLRMFSRLGKGGKFFTSPEYPEPA